MKDILIDIVAHTHSLGILPIVKITSDSSSTVIESMAEDRSVIMSATTKTPIKDFEGVFGLPNLDKLNLHLKNPEYKDNSTITIVKADRAGVMVPVSMHFENATRDFVNDYRFMTTEVINEKLKSVKFKGTTWNVEFEPSIAALSRLKLQAQANSEEAFFIAKTEGTDLKFFFGDHSSHAGNFVFHNNITGTLSTPWKWPVVVVQSILNLDGDKTMRFSNAGAAQITVDSGLCKYEYVLPAQTK